MKVNSTVYKGIEYIQISSLPADQRELLSQTINRDLLIKILVEGKLVRNCLQFKDYEVWFENIFIAQTPTTSLKTIKKEIVEESSQLQVDILTSHHSQIPESGTISNTLPSGSLK